MQRKRYSAEFKREAVKLASQVRLLALAKSKRDRACRLTNLLAK